MSAIDRNLKVIAIDDDPFELKLITHQLSMLGQKDVAGFPRALLLALVVDIGELHPGDEAAAIVQAEIADFLQRHDFPPKSRV